MRIVVAPFNRMNDTTLAAVREAGHEVLCTGEEVMSYREIEAQYPKNWRPDVFLFWSPEYHAIPCGLESAPCYKVAVFGDWNLGGQAIQQSAAIFDLLIADARGAERLRALGFSNVVSAPLWSFDPELHRYLPDVERDIDILLVGNFNHDIQRARAQWLARVARLSSHYKVLLTSGIFGDAYTELLNRAKIVFNRSIRGEINMRAYEAPACGAVLFYERENQEIQTLFKDRSECVLYGDDDLETLLDHYLNNETERIEIAAAGRLRVQRETPALHMVEILNKIDSARAGFKPEHLPEFCTLSPAEQEIRRVRQWLLTSAPRDIVAAESALQRADAAGATSSVTAGLRGYALAQAGLLLSNIDRSIAWQEAVDHWRLAVSLDPLSASNRLNLAAILLETGDSFGAEYEAWSALVLLESDDSQSIVAGDLYWNCRYRSFGVEYDRIEISHPHGTPEWTAEMRDLLRWRACELLADFAYSSGRYLESEGFASRACGFMPHLASGHYGYARALSALGHLSLAVDALRASLAINPFLADARTALIQTFIDSALRAEAIGACDDWIAIIKACPAYTPHLDDCNRLREAALYLAADTQVSEVKRLLAFPDWSEPVRWQKALDSFVDSWSKEFGLLMLWADPGSVDPRQILRRVADHFQNRHRLIPANFPKITLVSQHFRPNERWKLFHAADAVLECGVIPAEFADVTSASLLPSIPLETRARRAA